MLNNFLLIPFSLRSIVVTAMLLFVGNVSFSQVRPDQAPTKSPADTDEIYTQYLGVLNRIKFSDAKVYFQSGLSLSWNSATNELTIGGGNTVDISSLNTDNQQLTRSGMVLSLDDGGSVDLSPLFSGIDDQTLSFNSATGELTIQDGNTVDLSPLESDGSETKINAGTNVTSITGSGTIADPYVINVSSGTSTVGDGDYGDVTISNGVWTVTGGGSTECQESINQAAHGFSVGNVVYINTSGNWVLAQADVGTTIHDAIITEVTDSDNFTIQFCGIADITGQTYTVGVDYYTSEIIAGELRNTEPTEGYIDFIGVGRGGTKIQLKDVNAVNTGVDVSTPSFLLDDVSTSSGANVAYSLRRLSASYSGFAIEVRRTSDNTTQDIGFDGSGDLDESALTTFCASTDCHVTTWYDQSGNSLDATQTTNTKQPKIVSNGVVELENSKPTIVFDGSDDELEVGTVSSFNYLHSGTSSTLFYVSKSDGGQFGILGNNSGSQWNVGFSIFYTPINQIEFYLTYASTNYTSNQSNQTTDILSQHLYFTTIDADNSTASNRLVGSINDQADFSTNTNLASTSTNDAASIMTIANSAVNVSTNFDGSIQELVIFSTDESSLKSSFLTNINNYYALY